MKTPILLATIVLFLILLDGNSFAQTQKTEKADDSTARKTVPIPELLYMGKYWRGTRATYEVDMDAITLDDGREQRMIQWEIAPPSIQTPFAKFRIAAQAKLETKKEPQATPKPQSQADGLMVSGKVLFVVDDGVLIQRGKQIVMVEGVKGLADGETYSGRVRKTNRVYQYLLDYGMVANKRIYEKVTDETKPTDSDGAE